MADDFDWTSEWADRVITPAQAAAMVRDGDRVACSLPEPTAFLYALAERTEVRDVTVFMPTPRKGGVAVARHPGITVQAPFVSQILRRAGAEADVIPLRLQDWGPSLRRHPGRVSVVQVATPEPDGTVRPGSVLAGNGAMVLRDRSPDDVVLALVNPVVPHVPGDAYHIDDFDHLIEIPMDGAAPIFDGSAGRIGPVAKARAPSPASWACARARSRDSRARAVRCARRPRRGRASASASASGASARGASEAGGGAAFAGGAEGRSLA